MKKITILIISILLFFTVSPALKIAGADSNAEEIVLRIVNSGVYFYSNPDFKEKSKLFMLTRTYFIIGIDCGDYYAVEYKKNTTAEIDGYVKKSEVVVYEDGIPSLLYPEFKAATPRSLLTFYDIDTYSPRFNENVETLNCYGKITFNNNCYMLVNYEGQFKHKGPYYVNYDDLEITEPSDHPIPIKVVSKNPDDDFNNPVNNGDNANNSDETVQIIIIVAVIIFAVAVVFFIFRPNNYKYKKKDNENTLNDKQ